MAAYADEHGKSTVRTEKHHGADDDWLPAPFGFAGAVFGATRRIPVTVSADIGPLRPAERWPYTDPHPPLPAGGSSRAAGRPARPCPSSRAHTRRAKAHYEGKLTEYGTGGRTMIPAAQTPLPHLAGDPDRRWAEAEYGGHFPSEARTYTSSQSGWVR